MKKLIIVLMMLSLVISVFAGSQKEEAEQAPGGVDKEGPTLSE